MSRLLGPFGGRLQYPHSLLMICAATVVFSPGNLLAQAVDTVLISPESATLPPGATEQLTATLRDLNGRVLTERSVLWTSSDTGTVQVSIFGLVTALKVGSATITATIEGKTGAATIVVAQLTDSLAAPVPVRAIASGDLVNEVFVNSEAERYLRVLQSTNVGTPYPWSIRPFSPREVRRLLPADSSHSWQARFTPAEDTPRTFAFSWINPQVDVLFNSAFPYGTNDGPVWAGRGLTTVLRGGFSAEAGPFSLTVAPIAFRAENAAFPLGGSGFPQRPFADWRGPLALDSLQRWGIDFPQRFGEDAYTRIHAGQSTLRVDAYGVTAGISTANQHWGPASEYPLLLGSNAPGFWHAFAGTSRPLGVGIGSIHARLISGRAEQSAYSPMPADSAFRQLSGLVVVFLPRGLPGLEIGGARFFHSPWSGIGAESFARPFEYLFFEGHEHTADNQLASAFIRWVFPKSGFEFYGEYLREDYFYDIRDLVIGPDRHSAYLAGFRRSWQRAPGSILLLRGEVVNSRVSQTAPLGRLNPLYIHTPLRQGHTHSGQILGSPAVYGGAGGILAVDHYHRSGRRSVFWTRTLEDNGHVSTGNDAGSLDVIHSLGGELLLARGRLDFTGGVTGSYNFNRYGGSDVINMNLRLGIRLNN